jgi:hypothetical protein
MKENDASYGQRRGWVVVVVVVWWAWWWVWWWVMWVWWWCWWVGDVVVVMVFVGGMVLVCSVE